MMTKTLGVVVALAMMVALPMPAMASHFSQYLFTPTTHDDVGRSDEPNFVGTTSMLGPAVGDRNIDVNRDGIGESYPVGGVVAPGCTDNNGRQSSGLCGLWTVGVGTSTSGAVVPPRTAGVQGMSGNAAPGRFTPTKLTSIKLLDTIANVQYSAPAGLAPVTIVDLNHAIVDSPAAATLRGAGASFPFVFGPTDFLTWYGTWQDKNGNGVIDFNGKACDQTTGCGADGGVTSDNEFVWTGNCVGISGLPAPSGAAYCVPASPAIALPMWVVPGNHHASCFSAVSGVDCGLIGMDYPGHQAFCFADAVTAFVTGPIVGGGVTPAVCNDDFTQFDEFDADTGGDTILGEQNSVRRDDMFSDRTGDPAVHQRNWVWGSGFPTVFYDSSLLVTTTTVTAVTTQTQADTGSANYFDLTRATSTDVDRYSTWSPLANDLLQDSIKPTARSNWVAVRDLFIPVQKANDALTNDRLTYDQCDTSYLGVCPAGPLVGPTQGGLDDTVYNAGIPQEPNTAQDVEPGATYHATPCDANAFKGWCNSYAGYAAGWRGWIDVADVPGTYTQMGWSDPFGGGCLVCQWAGPSGLPSLPQARLDPNDHRQVLQPGSHLFAGIAGGWYDRVQGHKDTVLDLAALPALAFRDIAYTSGPDGWVGDVVNNTGFLRGRGYGPETCTINGVSAVREYAQCHPYADGNRDGPPNGYGSDLATGGEFQPAQSVSGGNSLSGQVFVSVTPNALNPGPNDCWTVPIIVWRSIDHWSIGNTQDIQNYQGTCGNAARIDMALGLSAGGVTDDQVFLPEGNLGQVVVTTSSGNIVVQPPSVSGVSPPTFTEFVRDVDVYAPFGA